MEVKELDKLIKDIGAVIGFYSCLADDFKDINRLISGKRKLVGYSFRFAELVGNALESYNNSYVVRKHKEAEKKLEYIKTGDSVAKAELQTELITYKLRIEEGKSEALYRKVKSQFDTIRDTINSMTQDISTLKNELHETKIHNNG